MNLTEILEQLEYCPDEGSPETGYFKRKRQVNQHNVGEWVGTVDLNGYRMIQIDRKKIKEHRLVFFLVHGFLPKKVDHRDLNSLNNHPGNLRSATDRENSCNRAKLKTNKSGYIGVTWHKASGKFAANIRVNGTAIYLGLFIEPLEAAKAYDRAAKEYHKEFAVLNIKEIS